MNNKYKYELEDYEIEVFEKWIEEQLEKDREQHSMIGGRFSIIFTPTGLGMMTEGYDNLFKEKKLLTDFDKW